MSFDYDSEYAYGEVRIGLVPYGSEMCNIYRRTLLVGTLRHSVASSLFKLGKECIQCRSSRLMANRAKASLCRECESKLEYSPQSGEGG
jgi:hypothetical protein